MVVSGCHVASIDVTGAKWWPLDAAEGWMTEAAGHPVVDLGSAEGEAVLKLQGAYHLVTGQVAVQHEGHDELGAMQVSAHVWWRVGLPVCCCC